MRNKRLSRLLKIALLTAALAPLSGIAAAQKPHPSDQTSAELKQSIKEDPLDIKAWYHLARTYLGMNSNQTGVSVNQDLETSGEFYDDALKLLETDEKNGAIIQLRNAIQTDPRNLAAYLLIAEIYQELNAPLSAENFLRQAQDNGADPSLVVVPMAEAMLKSEKYEEILSEIAATNLPLKRRAEIRVIQGKALMALQQYDQAKTALDEALQLDPSLMTAKIETARINTIEGNRKGALEVLSTIKDAGQYHPDYWLILAELEQQAGNTALAAEHYEQALKLSPEHRLALTALAQLTLEAGNEVDADKLIRKLRLSYPRDLRGLQLELALVTGQADARRIEEVTLAGKAVIDQLDYSKLQRDPLGLYVVGTIQHLSDHPAEAAAALASYLEFVPGDINALSLLISAQLDTGQFDSALRTIRSAPSELATNPSFQKLTVDVYIARKNYEAALPLLSQLIETEPDNRALKLNRARLNATLGKHSAALEELKSLHFEKEEPEVRNTLANVLLALGEFDEVLELVTDQQDTGILRGKAQLAKRELEAARSSFESAAKKEQTAVEARFNLAVIDRLEGNVDAAATTLEKLLKENPSHTPAMLQLSAIAESRGDYMTTARYLKDAIAIRPDRDRHIRLIEILLADNREQEARTAMSDLKNQFPADLKVMSTEAQLAIDSGNTDRARQIYIAMKNQASLAKKPGDLVDIARYQFSIDDREAAYQTLDATAKLNPQYLPLLVTRAEFLQNEGNSQAAILIAEEVIKLDPAQPIGYRLKGDLLRQQQDTEAAIDAYARGIANTQGSVALTLGYYGLLREVRGPADAFSFLNGYVANKPAVSYAIMRVLAAGYSDIGDYEQSIDLHQALMKERSNDPILLNNLAMAYFLSGDRRARETAEAAYQLAPENYAVMDTLGWILINQDELSLGVTMLRNALARSANAQDIRYHYAVALSKSGQTRGAIKELRTLLSEGTSFAEADAAAALLRQLTQTQE